MIFFPSESFILGAFILAAVVLVLSIVMKALTSLASFSYVEDESNYRRLSKRVSHLSVVLVVLAFALGIYASIIPSGEYAPDVTIEQPAG